MDKPKKAKFLEGFQKMLAKGRKTEDGSPKSDRAVEFKQAFKEKTQDWELSVKRKPKVRTKQDRNKRGD